MAADVDIRLYGADGKRKNLPRDYVTSLTFELLERGGFGTGSLEIVAGWTDLTFAGTERLDVYLFGTLAYRGWLRVPTRGLDTPETFTPTLYGLIQLLDKWQMTCRYAYPYAVDISTLFTDLVSDHVIVSGRLQSLVLDSQFIGIPIQQFDAVGKSVAQAINQLCDLSPNSAIWGFDVDSSLADRVYLRPKGQTVTRRYAVGGQVTALTYPEETPEIVNKLYISGGKVAQPNLIVNGSFEFPLPASAELGNLLGDYSFELNTSWSLSGGATRKQSPSDNGQPHSGSWWLELDTNGEKAEQTVAVVYSNALIASFWAVRETVGTPRQVKGEVEGLAAGGSVVVTIPITAYVDPGDTYTKYTADVDFGSYPTVVSARFRVQTNGGSASQDGVNVDDCALYERYGIFNSGWTYNLAGAAKVAVLDWQHNAIAAYHGCYCVKMQASGIATSADYLEIRTARDARPRVEGGQTYTLAVPARKLSSDATFSVGIVEYNADGSGAITSESATNTASSADFNANVYTLQVLMNAKTVEVEVFIRMKNNQALYVDGVMLMKGLLPAEFTNLSAKPSYWEGGQYEKQIDVTNADLVDLEATPASSITDWGLLEGRASVESVVDYDTAVAYATAYFNAHATPRLSAGLTIRDCRELLLQDGLVRLLNLPAAVTPPALFPVRVSYTVRGDTVDLTADLGNERPDMADLLRFTEKHKP